MFGFLGFLDLFEVSFLLWCLIGFRSFWGLLYWFFVWVSRFFCWENWLGMYWFLEGRWEFGVFFGDWLFFNWLKVLGLGCGVIFILILYCCFLFLFFLFWGFFVYIWFFLTFLLDILFCFRISLFEVWLFIRIGICFFIILLFFNLLIFILCFGILEFFICFLVFLLLFVCGRFFCFLF